MLTAEDIERRLEEAGKTLMLLPVPKNGRPAGFVSNWPATVQTFADWWAAQVAADEESRSDMASIRNAVRIQAQQKDVDRLDEVLGWYWLIADVRKRRIVSLRSLVHPISERHLYSYRKLARFCGLSERSVRNWHADGIEEIRRGLMVATKPVAEVRVFR